MGQADQVTGLIPARNQCFAGSSWSCHSDATALGLQEMVPRSALIASLNCRTRRAKPSHRKPGAEEFETKAFSRISTCSKHLFTLEFFRATAGNTDEVVVIVIIIGGQLKTLATFWLLQLPQEIHGGEQPERPVDGGQRNP